MVHMYLSIIVSIVLTSTMTQAFDSALAEDRLVDDTTKYELPLDISTYKTGYAEAPVIPCPKPKKKYLDMLTQLGAIKQKIKDETCSKTKVDAINKEVGDLEGLLTTKRKSFIDTVQKGVSGNEQLTQKEVEGLQSYIDQVVKKTAAVTGLVKNEGCFDEDEQVSTLSTLSALVADVSGAIGALAGPFGAKISLGGKLAASLLGSIDTIVQANKTYEYEKFEDRKNYLNNLCAYYEFKNDLDKETDSLTYFDKLYEMLEQSNKLQNQLSDRCDDCLGIMEEYLRKNRKSTSQSSSLESLRMGEPVLSADVPLVSEQVRDQVMDVITAGRSGYEEGFDIPMHETIVNAADSLIASGEMSDVQILLYYERKGVIEGVPENLNENDLGLQGRLSGDRTLQSGSEIFADDRVLTVHVLQMNSWVLQELQDLNTLDRDGLEADGRREVMRVQDQIENFLVDREGRRYIEFYTKLLKRDFDRLELAAIGAHRRLYQLRALPDPNFGYNDTESDVALAIHEVFRSGHQLNSVVQDYISDKDVKRVLRESRPSILDALEAIRVDYHILTQRCQFFTNSLFKGNRAMETACKRMESKRREVTEFFIEMKKPVISFNKRYGEFLKFATEESKNFSADWLDSTYKIFNSKLDPQ